MQLFEIESVVEVDFKIILTRVFVSSRNIRKKNKNLLNSRSTGDKETFQAISFAFASNFRFVSLPTHEVSQSRERRKHFRSDNYLIQESATRGNVEQTTNLF